MVGMQNKNELLVLGGIFLWILLNAKVCIYILIVLLKIYRGKIIETVTSLYSLETWNQCFYESFESFGGMEYM